MTLEVTRRVRCEGTLRVRRLERIRQERLLQAGQPLFRSDLEYAKAYRCPDLEAKSFLDGYDDTMKDSLTFREPALGTHSRSFSASCGVMFSRAVDIPLAFFSSPPRGCIFFCHLQLCPRAQALGLLVVYQMSTQSVPLKI